MGETQARAEIRRVGASLYARGYVHGTAGNVSVLLDDGGMLITPTDACLGILDADALARLDAEGRQLGGARASKTALLHARLYAAARRHDPGVRCVIHTHSTHCVAASLTAPVGADELLPAITPYFVMKVGHVPLIAYHRPGSAEAAAAVVAAVERYGSCGTPIRAAMLTALGPIVWHESPASAMAVLEELEETARLQVLTRGSAPALSDAALAALRDRFGARW